MVHVAYSDFGVTEQFARKHPGFEGLLNVIEDALIERRAMQRWPGVRANLDAMFAQIRDRVAQLIGQRGPFDRFCTAVYLKLVATPAAIAVGWMLGVPWRRRLRKAVRKELIARRDS